MGDDWIEHRRGRDGERLGWMRPSGEGFVVVDLLGRERTGPVDWLEAEGFLEDLGIGYLADPYEMRTETGGWLRVRLAEVSPVRVTVKKDDWGDMTAPQVYSVLPFPPGDVIRPLVP
jgi:hypothetical protein